MFDFFSVFSFSKPQALVEIARANHVNSISLISSNHEASKIFVAEATTSEIRVPRILELNPKDLSQLADQVRAFVTHSRQLEPVIALIVTAEEAAVIADKLTSTLASINVRPRWLVASLGLKNKRLSSWKNLFHGGVYVEPFMPELDEFKSYFFNALQVSDESF